MFRRLIVSIIVPGLAAIVAVGALITISAAQGTGVRGTGENPAIVPGQGIAGYRLGQDIASILVLLGPLRSQDDLPDAPFTGYYWPLKRIGVIADKSTGKVVGLVASLDDALRTDKGVGAGTEMGAIRSAYGGEDLVDNHQDDEILVYNKLGIAFVVDKKGALGSRVSVVFVFDPGHYRDIFKEEQ